MHNNFRTFVAALLVAAAAMPAMAQTSPVSPAPPADAGAKPQWRLLVFQAFRPGVLSMCRDAHRWPSFAQLAMPEAEAPGKARWVDEPLTVRWNGGEFSHAAASGDVAAATTAPPAPPPSPPSSLADRCFTLFVNDRPVLSGAVLHPFSARLLDFPVLVLPAPRTEGPAMLTLVPRFPGQLSEPVPAWSDVLPKTGQQ